MRPNGYTIQILIVEDTLSQLRLYSHILAQAGYSIAEATTAEAARCHILEERPDIVLLDLVLPDGDGREICSWIKNHPDLAQTYVIMLSAYKVTQDDRISGLEAGADDYMIKPVLKRELLARVKVAARFKTTQLALQASEAKHRTVVENSPDLIMRLDREGLPVYVNPRILDHFGVTPEAFLSLTYQEMGLDRSFMERWYSACAAVVSTGRQQEITIHITYAQQVKYFDARFVPEFDINGRVHSILVVLRDDTERLRAEQAIARLAAVVQQSTDAVVICEPSGQVQYANAAFQHLMAQEELPDNATFAEIIRAETLREQFTGVRDHQAPWEGITTIQRSNGTRVAVSVSLFPILARDGTVTSVVTILRDLTERQRNEREREVLLTIASALRIATTRQEVVRIVLTKILELLDVSGAALIVKDPNSDGMHIEHAVGEHAYLSGITVHDETGITRRMLDEGITYRNNDVWNTLPPSLQAHLGSVRAILGVPMLVRQQAIGVIWIGSPTPIGDDVMAILSAIADMAANTLHRVSLFEELERHAAELEQRVLERTHELAEANQRLLELDRLKSKFVSNVSHELRTPISNLKLYMSLLQRGKPEKRAHYESMLNLSVERLGQLVEDILNLSRLEIAHYQPRELEPTDLNAVVNKIIAVHQAEAESAGLKLQFQPAENLPLIYGDYNQLAQLVTNLVVNALHYTPRGHVRVSTNLNGGSKVCLEVEDTGIGILPEDVPHVFERFYRGNNRQAGDVPGTGLGLAIVKEIVDIHHGEISLESRPDVGTRVQVTLPIAYPPDAG